MEKKTLKERISKIYKQKKITKPISRKDKIKLIKKVYNIYRKDKDTRSENINDFIEWLEIVRDECKKTGI